MTAAKKARTTLRRALQAVLAYLEGARDKANEVSP